MGNLGNPRLNKRHGYATERVGRLDGTIGQCEGQCEAGSRNPGPEPAGAGHRLSQDDSSAAAEGA